MGGAVRVSNKLLVPNDFIMFEGGDDTNGFLGYMLTRTPIGKRNDTDAVNYWTIVLDTANFAGPAMYVSNYWDMRTNWDPTSASWSDPRSLIGYIAQGFEGGVGSFATTSGSKDLAAHDKGFQWTATPRLLPQAPRCSLDTLNTTRTGRSKAWNRCWPAPATHLPRPWPVLRAKARSERIKPSCNLPQCPGKEAEKCRWRQRAVVRKWGHREWIHDSGSDNTSGCSCRCYGWGGNNCEQAQVGCNTTAWSPSPSASVSVPSSSPTNPSRGHALIPSGSTAPTPSSSAPTPSSSAASVPATPSSSSGGDPELVSLVSVRGANPRPHNGGYLC